MTVREQKLEQDKALSIQFQRSFYPRQGGYFQGGGRRGRSYGRGGTAPFSNGNHHCGSQVEAVGSSTVKTAWGEIKLGNILYVPTLKCSLLLVGSLTEQGHIIVFTDSQCIILNNHKEQTILAIGKRDLSNGLYRFTNKSLEADRSFNGDIHLWHNRYGHLHYARLQHLSRAARVIGLPILGYTKKICGDYLAGRQHRGRFPKTSPHMSTHVLQLIHSNLVGPIRTPSLVGSRYIVVFTDDFSRKSFVYFMKNESETFGKFREFKSRVESGTGKKILMLRRQERGIPISWIQQLLDKPWNSKANNNS